MIRKGTYLLCNPSLKTTQSWANKVYNNSTMSIAQLNFITMPQTCSRIAPFNQFIIWRRLFYGAQVSMCREDQPPYDYLLPSFRDSWLSTSVCRSRCKRYGSVTDIRREHRQRVQFLFSVYGTEKCAWIKVHNVIL